MKATDLIPVLVTVFESEVLNGDETLDLHEVRTRLTGTRPDLRAHETGGTLNHLIGIALARLVNDGVLLETSVDRERSKSRDYPMFTRMIAVKGFKLSRRRLVQMLRERDAIAEFSHPLPTENNR